MLPSISQGITTECLGQDGSYVCPLTDSIIWDLADNMAPESDAPSVGILRVWVRGKVKFASGGL